MIFFCIKVLIVLAYLVLIKAVYFFDLMSYKIEFNSTKNINKSYTRSLLEGLYIGNIFSLNYKNYPFFMFTKNIFKYMFSKQILPNLKESEVREIDNYSLIRNKLITYYQLKIPYILSSSEYTQAKKIQEYSELFNNLEELEDLEIFYYDREELIEDYNYYFQELDKKIDNNLYIKTKAGLDLKSSIRANLPNVVEDMINHYKARNREAFLLISVNCLDTDKQKLEKCKLQLANKSIMIQNILEQVGIEYLEVSKNHKKWLFNNYISHTTKY